MAPSSIERSGAFEYPLNNAIAPTRSFGSKQTFVSNPWMPPECCTHVTPSLRIAYHVTPHASVHSSLPRYRAVCISFKVESASTGDPSVNWNEIHRDRSSTQDHRPPSAQTASEVSAGSSWSESHRALYPVARRGSASSGSGSKNEFVIPSGSRIAERTRSTYGAPVNRATTSPSNWYARFEYFCCVFAATRVPISPTRSRLRPISPSYLGADQSVPGGSLVRPDSCESIRRIVTVSIGPNGLAASPSSGTCATIGSSRCRRPSSRSCMIAVPVNVFVIDAIR
jgi:hypothetical protein